MTNTQKCSCLRCGRTLDEGELRCRNCQADDARAAKVASCQSGIESPDQTKNGMSNSDRLFGILGILMFAVVILMMGVGFLKEMTQNGLFSAVQNKPAILWVLSGVFILSLLGSREKLEKLGLGAIHKVLRTVLWLVVICVVLVIAFSILDSLTGPSPSGLPDNVRF